ncbi:MAG: TonB-dependent receptor plug domain-containing protein, partial [Pseudomonadota bacterium]
MTFRRKLTFGVAALFAVGGSISLPSYAQEDADTEETGARTLDVITVNAQRREENIQDVPVAVTALSTDQLNSRLIADVNDLGAQVPNIVISTGTGTSSSARIFLRGVGEDESRGAIDPAVGIYIDGVYVGRTVGSLVDLLDIAQVEVLRGPQGTLYGRNTNGGAIKLTSAAPDTERSSFDADLTTGSDERIALRTVGNLALSDFAAVRVAALYKEREGFFTLNPNGAFADQAQEDFGDEEVLSFRGSALVNFTDNWTGQLIIDYTDDDTEPVPSSIIDESLDPAVPGDADGNIFTVEPLAGVTCASPFQDGCFTDYSSNVESLGATFKLNGSIGLFDIDAISGYRALEDELDSFISFPFSQVTDQDQFTQEINVSSNFSGPFNFVSGLYFYTEDLALDTVFAGVPADIDVETTSFAVFGVEIQTTYKIKWPAEV